MFSGSLSLSLSLWMFCKFKVLRLHPNPTATAGANTCSPASRRLWPESELHDQAGVIKKRLKINCIGPDCLIQCHLYCNIYLFIHVWVIVSTFERNPWESSQHIPANDETKCRHHKNHSAHFRRCKSGPTGTPFWTRLIIEQGQFPKDITQTQPRQRFAVESVERIHAGESRDPSSRLWSQQPVFLWILDGLSMDIHGLGSFLMGTEKHQLWTGNLHQLPTRLRVSYGIWWTLPWGRCKSLQFLSVAVRTCKNLKLKHTQVTCQPACRQSAMASFDCTLHIRFEYHQFVDDLPLSLLALLLAMLDNWRVRSPPGSMSTISPSNPQMTRESISLILSWLWTLSSTQQPHQIASGNALSLEKTWESSTLVKEHAQTSQNRASSTAKRVTKKSSQALGFPGTTSMLPRSTWAKDLWISWYLWVTVDQTIPKKRLAVPSACQSARWTARCRCLPSCAVHHETTRLRRSSKCRSWGAGLKTSAPLGTCQGDHLCWEQLKEPNRCRRQCWIATPPDHGLGASPLTETTAFSGMWVLPMRLCLCQKMALATYVK